MRIERYWENKVRYEQAINDIKILEADIHSIKSGIGGDVPVKGGGGSNKLDDYLDRKQKLQDGIKRLEPRLEKAEYTVSLLNEKERTAAHLLFMQGLNTAKAVNMIIDNGLECSERSAYRLRESIIKHYNSLFGSDIDSDIDSDLSIVF